MEKHSKLSASGSSRWLLCPGSLVKDNLNEDKEQNEAAREGTACHEIAENSLYLGDDAKIFLNQIVDGITVTEDMVNHANSYIDYYRSFYHKDHISGFEHRVSYEKYAEGGFGTVDAFIIDSTNKICHVFDLKYGRKLVEVVDNTQLQLYALGLCEMYKLKNYNFKLHIVQPRLYSFDDFDISYKELMVFAKYVKERAKIALSDNAERVPGESQCEWCHNNPTCKKLNNYVENIINNTFDNLNEELDNNIVSKEKLETFFANRKLIESYTNKIEVYLFNSMLAGEKYNTLKLVEARKHRQFTNEAEDVLVKVLGDEAYQPKKLITITQAEKIVKDKDLINTITFKPKGEPVIASIKDKRAALNIAELEFDNLSDNLSDGEA